MLPNSVTSVHVLVVCIVGLVAARAVAAEKPNVVMVFAEGEVGSARR
jgi:hypothetical protein